MKEKYSNEFNLSLDFLCSVLLFYSCNNHEKYDFESSDEALNEYDNLYKTVRSQETCNAEQLASFINLWYECSDTVYKFIQKDPSFTAHAGLTMRFDSITDSIRTRLMELADNFTLSDVAYVKLHTSIYGQDKELDSLKRHATVFFPHWIAFLYIPGILETYLPITQSFCFHINYMGYTQKMRFFDLSVWKTSSSEAFLLPLTSAQLWVWRILLI